MVLEVPYTLGEHFHGGHCQTFVVTKLYGSR
jgi:hypothetical protein